MFLDVDGRQADKKIGCQMAKRSIRVMQQLIRFTSWSWAALL